MNTTASKIEVFDQHFNLVTAAINSGDYVTAEKQIQNLCQIAPNDENIFFALIDVRIAMENFEGATATLELILNRFNALESVAKRYSEYQDKIKRATLERDQNSTLNSQTLFEPFKADAVIYPGLKIIVLDSISQLMNYYGFSKLGQFNEKDIDVVKNECDLFQRMRRDTEVITTIAANADKSVLELGTSHGVSTHNLSINLKPSNKVYTVNILPEQFGGDFNLVTHLIPKEEIGSYYREFNPTNVVQIYENTLSWKIPSHITELSMVFIDAAHDTDAVFKDSLLTWERLAPGGIMVWHDFSPLFRGKFGWIDSVMNGVKQFLQEIQFDREVVNLRNSWMGCLRKPFR